MAFLTAMADGVTTLDTYGNLLRMSIASPGNDFSLRTTKASPAIISTYFGEDLTAYLEEFQNVEDAAYVPGKNMLSIGIKDITAINVLPSRTATVRLAKART